MFLRQGAYAAWRGGRVRERGDLAADSPLAGLQAGGAEGALHLGLVDAVDGDPGERRPNAQRPHRVARARVGVEAGGGSRDGVKVRARAGANKASTYAD